MRIIAGMLCILMGLFSAEANNIQITNLSLANQSSVTKTVEVKFDVSWENSWRLTNGPANWDAAWLFVKFHSGDNNWRHAFLSTNDNDHVAPVGSTIRVGLTSTNGMGVFIYRSSPGSGNVDYSNVHLLWRYGDNGVSDAALVSVDVTGIEMVYVPEGSFYLGDGRTNISAFSDGGSTTSDLPFLVTGEGSIPFDDTPGALWNANLINIQNTYSNVPAHFPKGYRAFYCMKYPVSQGQYIDAHNKNPSYLENVSNTPLTRRPTSGSAPNAVALTPDRAMHSASLTSGNLPYLDWAGLRPMSEMEYEKACRGPLPPVPGEFAWGTAVRATLPYTLANDGTADESVSLNYDENAGNAWYYTTSRGPAGTNNGPCRVGMFAKASYNGNTSARIQSGASYYGIMHLSDNVRTPVIEFYVATTEDPARWQFNGEHGDGNPPSYPSTWYNQFEPAIAYKGENDSSSASEGPTSRSVSYRTTAAGSFTGIRGVRTAP